MDVVDEVKKIKKKEQELYKFILQQFLDLEEFKKSFSSSIAKTVDLKLEEIDIVLSNSFGFGGCNASLLFHIWICNRSC